MPKEVNLKGLKPFEVDEISVGSSTPPKKLMIKPTNKKLDNFRQK